MDRVQRKRIKGFKLPLNTLVITRGTPFGNPWKKITDFQSQNMDTGECILNTNVVALFEDRLTINSKQLFVDTCENRGIEHLACFCPVDSPCHGDVWLQVWEDYKNQPKSENQ